jgi:hypothetical protein
MLVILLKETVIHIADKMSFENNLRILYLQSNFVTNSIACHHFYIMPKKVSEQKFPI